MSDELWNAIRGCFETDDGSLPSIEINCLSTGDVEAIYSSLRERSRLWNNDAVFWDVKRKCEVPVDSVENAASLVAQKIAEPFHICLTELTVKDVTLPDLGVFILPDSIELDYRMGAEWSRDRVAALFLLLCQLANMALSAAIEPSWPEGPSDPDVFRRVWTTLHAEFAKQSRKDDSRLARECAKLDPVAEQRMAEEGFAGEVDQWPEF